MHRAVVFAIAQLSCLLGAYRIVAKGCRIVSIVSGTVKATNFQFSKHVLSIDRNKRPLQILEKVALG